MFVVLQNVEYNRNVQCAKNNIKRGVVKWVLQMKQYGLILMIAARKKSSETLAIVYRALEEKGYNPINQIVGYLLSGDPAYIPRYQDARNLIRRHERDEILEVLIRYYLGNHGINL